MKDIVYKVYRIVSIRTIYSFDVFYNAIYNTTTPNSCDYIYSYMRYTLENISNNVIRTIGNDILYTSLQNIIINTAHSLYIVYSYLLCYYYSTCYVIENSLSAKQYDEKFEIVSAQGTLKIYPYIHWPHQNNEILVVPILYRHTVGI